MLGYSHAANVWRIMTRISSGPNTLLSAQFPRPADVDVRRKVKIVECLSVTRRRGIEELINIKRLEVADAITEIKRQLIR